jgi:hypothetical protein
MNEQVKELLARRAPVFLMDFKKEHSWLTFWIAGSSIPLVP